MDSKLLSLATASILGQPPRVRNDPSIITIALSLIDIDTLNSKDNLQMLTLYGIKNCDTIKKASRYCQDHSIKFRLHDYRVDGLDQTQLLLWVKELGWEALVNKRSTTWRGLSDQIKNQIDEASAMTAMLAHPSLIKRPLLEYEGRYMLGFSVAQYDAFFNCYKRE